MHSGLLDPFPLWTILPLTIAISLLAVEAGYRYGLFRHDHEKDEKESPLGVVVLTARH